MGKTAIIFPGIGYHNPIKKSLKFLKLKGFSSAGEGNRTPVFSLEG